MATYGLDGLAEKKDEYTRTITAENPDGKVGAGGQTASHLGHGRKGRPSLTVSEGETTTLAKISGPGEIRHIWMTVPNATDAGDYVLRDLVLRIYWDGEADPSVEVPLGDFFCNGHSQRCSIDSLPIVVAPTGGMNTYFPMPFHSSAKITVESEHPQDIDALFYQIDYALIDSIPDDVAYFHAQWRRENPTTIADDYTILDRVEGEGHFVGTYLAWTALSPYWWGEGEFKAYIDGDEEFPTICGTGTEDYVGGAWGFGDTYSTPFLGYPLHDTGEEDQGQPPRHSMYRWHIPDPIRFTEDLQITIQQIGANSKEGLFERSDDVSSVAYWYQDEPHTPFPEFPSRRERRPR